MINFNSPQQVSALLFGGKFKLEERLPIKNELGVIQKYKSGDREGEIKYHNVKTEYNIKGFNLKPLPEWKQENSDYYSVDETTLDLLSKKKNHIVSKVAKLLMKRRELVKQIDTYYEGIKKLTYDCDSCMHPQINVVSTDTGRTSSKYPNSQNIPRKQESKVKQIFTSRFQDGVIIEFDWSTIEIMVWAVLTKDPTLLNIIKSGQDTHRFVGSKVLNCKPDQITVDQRQLLKPANFTLIYGGTDWNLVHKDGLDEELARKAYNTFWNIFHVARIWSDNLMHEIDNNAKLIDKEGNMISWYRGPTGRMFWFKNYPKKISDFCRENRIYSAKGFKYSEVMNYKVQSLATADIHLIALGKLFREVIKHRDKFLMINTIHDSVMFDSRKEYVDECCNLVKPVLESVVDDMKKVFNIDINVPLKVEYKVGNSWYDC